MQKRKAEKLNVRWRERFLTFYDFIYIFCISRVVCHNWKKVLHGMEPDFLVLKYLINENILAWG